jgi:hypothetical protein
MLRKRLPEQMERMQRLLRRPGAMPLPDGGLHEAMLVLDVLAG